MNFRHKNRIEGLSLLECMITIQLLAILFLALMPLLYAGFSLKWSARVRTDAVHLAQRRQEVSKSLIVAGGCVLSSQNGQESVQAGRRRCRLDWSIAPAAGGGLPGGGGRIFEVKSAVQCPGHSAVPVVSLCEWHRCR